MEHYLSENPNLVCFSYPGKGLEGLCQLLTKVHKMMKGSTCIHTTITDPDYYKSSSSSGKATACAFCNGNKECVSTYAKIFVFFFQD